MTKEPIGHMCYGKPSYLRPEDCHCYSVQKRNEAKKEELAAWYREQRAQAEKKQDERSNPNRSDLNTIFARATFGIVIALFVLALGASMHRVNGEYHLGTEALNTEAK